MHIDIIPIDLSQKPVLRQMMEFYCYDFSDMLNLELSEHGWYGYKYLDLYWLEEGRHPFFVTVDGHYAGFVLVNQHFDYLDDPEGHKIAEFFILRKYRKQGLGATVARRVFELFPGKWEVSVILKNPDGMKFWETVIQAYTLGQAEVHELYPEKGARKTYIFAN